MKVLRIFKVRDSGNAEFWVSNLVIMASTILGVYLAAQAGYKTAVDFEAARNERAGYYLQRSMVDEVKDNLKAVDEWSAEFEKVLRAQISADYFLPTDSWVTYWADKNGCCNAGSSSPQPEDIRINTYIWETMKEQPTTLEIPSDSISAVRRFYDNIEANMADIRAKSWKSGRAAKRIMEDVRVMREEVVPAIEKDIAELRDILKSKSVTVR